MRSVEELRRRVAAGEYRVDPRAVADAMLLRRAPALPWASPPVAGASAVKQRRVRTPTAHVHRHR